MGNSLLWKITILRPGNEYGVEGKEIEGTLVYHFPGDYGKVITIGSAPTCDILLRDTQPSHAFLQIARETFTLHAHKKIVCHYLGQARDVDKTEDLKLPLSSIPEGGVCCTLQIKDTFVRSDIQADRDLLPDDWMQRLVQKYGPLTKVGENAVSLLYRTDAGVPRILKVARPCYRDAKTARFFTSGTDIPEKLRDLQLPALEPIFCPELDLYGQVLADFQGETIYEYVARYKKLDIKMCIQVVSSLAQILAYFHCRREIYGLVSPRHLLLDQGQCRLSLDFAEAALAREHCEVLPNFTAPELWTNPKTADGRADIFALGSLLYFMVTGLPTFLCHSASEYRNAMERGLFSPEFPEANRLAMQFQPLILQCLGQHPDQRLGSVAEFWREFRRITSVPDIELPVPEREPDVPCATGPSPEEGGDGERHIGNFKILAELGRGPYAVVYRGIDTDSGDEVALKVFEANDIDDDIDPVVLLGEAQNAFILEHPHIARVYKTGKAGNFYYIAFQYVAGINLRQYREKQALSPRQVLIFVRDVAHALQHAHSRGIVHRDVKPSNILIDDGDHAYLTDFGSVKNFESERVRNSARMFGTLKYIAPELLEGFRPSPLQDVYSLGAILYEFLTGHALIDGLSSVEIISKITADHPAPRRFGPQIAGDAEAICLKALEKNPLRRYQSAGALAEDIDRFIEFRPILARPPSIWYSLYKKALRYPNLATYVTISILFAMLFALYVALVWSDTQKRRHWQQVRAQAIAIREKAVADYLAGVDFIPQVPDPTGLTPESFRAEEYILSEIRRQTVASYRDSLWSQTLSIYRQVLSTRENKGVNQDVERLVRETIRVSEEKIDSSMPLEFLDAVNDPDATAEVRLDVSPGERLFLYRFKTMPDGRKSLCPFDPVLHREVLEERARDFKNCEDFLRCRNLLCHAAFEMLNQDYLVARNLLIRSIEIDPYYIDAYFLLCCVCTLSYPPQDFTGETEIWRRRAVERITACRLSREDKAKLCEYFTPEFMQRAKAVYLAFPQRNFTAGVDLLVSVTASSPANPLRPGDRIIGIDGRPVLSLEDIPREKSAVHCQVVRDFCLQSLKLDSAWCLDPGLRLAEGLPIFYIWDDMPLEWTHPGDRLPELPENEIAQDAVSLPQGDYVLVCKADGHLTVRYPFSVALTPTPVAGPVCIDLPPLTAQLGEFLQNFAAVPGEFLAPYHEPQCMTGCLISRWEVTAGEWLRYLEAQHEPPEKLRKRLPQTKPSVFHSEGGHIVLCTGRPDWPVYGLSYRQIQDYLTWLNTELPPLLKERGFRFRLPTDKEWAAAARGSDHRLYPWGDYANPKLCKTACARYYLSLPEPIARANPAFCHDESPFGIRDMAGSVAEYTGNTSREIPSPYAIKGAGFSDAYPVPIDYTCFNAATRTSVGFRLCAGLDPLYHK